MFKYETHLHTSETSACANSTGAEMAVKYKEEGYTGIIVTDHFFNGNTTVPRDLPWEERVELFCKGYENAKAKGDEIGLDVYFGFEYTYHGSDFLVYGLDKQWLMNNDRIMDMKLYRFLDHVHACGGRVIHAHPFRDYDYIPMMTFAPHRVDGVEVVNTSHADPAFDERARMFAEWYNLPVTCGSDAHNTTDRWYGGGVLTERKLTSALDYVDAVIMGKARIIEKNK